MFTVSFPVGKRCNNRLSYHVLKSSNDWFNLKCNGNGFLWVFRIKRTYLKSGLDCGQNHVDSYSSFKQSVLFNFSNS